MKSQIISMGFSFDYNTRIITSHEEVQFNAQLIVKIKSQLKKFWGKKFENTWLLASISDPIIITDRFISRQ